MGHSNMTVSLGYLRNLELPTLTMEDVPVLTVVELVGLRVRILCVQIAPT